MLLLLLLLLLLLPLCALLVLARADDAAWVWAWVRNLVCMSCPTCAINNCQAALSWGWGGGWEGTGGGPWGPSPLITVQPPTKFYFCQSRATPEPPSKYIINDTRITPKAKKRYLPGCVVWGTVLRAMWDIVVDTPAHIWRSELAYAA